jgi:hypothetical protein
MVVSKNKIKSKSTVKSKKLDKKDANKFLKLISSPLAATIGTTIGTLLAKEASSFVYHNYGKYAIGYTKEKKCFHDYDQLLPTYGDKLTFKFYMDNKLYNIRQNYNDDIKNGKIDKFNKENLDKKIESVHDYINARDFNHLRPRVNKITSK